MIITNVSTDYIQVTSGEIKVLIAIPSDYSKIEVTASQDCGTSITKTLNNPFVATTDLALLGIDSIKITPHFFGLTTIPSGIFKVSVKIFVISPLQTILIANCAFVDIDVACKVAALLHNIIGEYEDKTAEKPSIIAHVLHYSLVNGSNCGCNCDEMCKNYSGLVDILTNIDPKLIADCGC